MCEGSSTARLGALRTTSSGAAEAAEEVAVGSDDPVDSRRDGRRVPHIALERAAQQDAVEAGEHVAPGSGGGVKHLRLRLQHGELATNGVELRVAEQVAGTDAGAVENQRLGQGCEISGRGESADRDLAPRAKHVRGQLTKEA